MFLLLAFGAAEVAVIEPDDDRAEDEAEEGAAEDKGVGREQKRVMQGGVLDGDDLAVLEGEGRDEDRDRKTENCFDQRHFSLR